MKNSLEEVNVGRETNILDGHQIIKTICRNRIIGLILSIIFTTIVLTVRFSVNYKLKFFIIEMFTLADLFISVYQALFRCGSIFLIVVVMIYAFLHFKNVTVFDRKGINKSSVEKSNNDQINTYNSEENSKKPNEFPSWEKTVENCWFSLDFASMRLKKCKETLGNKLAQSNQKLSTINNKIKVLEESLNQQNQNRRDAASNTDIIVNYMNPNSGETDETNSVDSELTTDPSSINTTSSSVKCNILEKVLEMRLGNNKELPESENKVQPRYEIQPILQWSMPREIFSFSSAFSSTKFTN